MPPDTYAVPAAPRSIADAARKLDGELSGTEPEAEDILHHIAGLRAHARKCDAANLFTTGETCRTAADFIEEVAQQRAKREETSHA